MAFSAASIAAKVPPVVAATVTGCVIADKPSPVPVNAKPVSGLYVVGANISPTRLPAVANLPVPVILPKPDPTPASKADVAAERGSIF